MDHPEVPSAAGLPVQAAKQTQPGRWVPLPRGLRWQSTLTAVAVVAVALLAGGLLLLVTLESDLVAGTDSFLRTKVQDVAALIQSQDAEEASIAVAATAKKDPQVQILDGTGKVIGASEPRLLTTPLSPLRPAAGQSATHKATAPALLGDGDERYLASIGSWPDALFSPRRTPSGSSPGSCWLPCRCCWAWWRGPCISSLADHCGGWKGSGRRSAASAPEG
jgi:hypothetical protein